MTTRIWMLLVCSSVLFCAHAQDDTPKKVVGSFVYNGAAYNYEFAKSAKNNYVLRVTTVNQPPSTPPSTNSDSLVSTPKLIEPRQASSDHVFSQFDESVFRNVFESQMITTHHQTTGPELHDLSGNIFYSVNARFDFTDDEPVTAYLKLRHNHVRSQLKANRSPSYEGKLSYMYAGHDVESVTVEIEDGAIKNIIAHFIKPGTEPSPLWYAEFKNVFPISISGKYDPEYLANIKLHCMNCYGYKGLDRFMQLSDLLEFDIQPENDKENYSPANCTVELRPTHTIAELKKEKRSRIVEVAAFSDFVGMDQDQPNGLIQIEAKRKINIVTKSRLIHRFESMTSVGEQLDLPELYKFDRKQVRRKHLFSASQTRYRFTQRTTYPRPNITSKNIQVKDTTLRITHRNDSSEVIAVRLYTVTVKDKQFRPAYFTLFNYIEPKLLFSKLDQNNRFIDSAALAGNQIDPVKLIQYQLVSFGVNLNVIKFSYPNLKLSWNALSAGVYWSKTRVGFASDSTRASVPIHSSLFQLSTEVQFKPDSRWGATLGINYIKPRIWNSTYELASTHPILQPYFEGYLKTNSTDKLFFRFRWAYEHDHHENNFNQIQLGYSMNLFAQGSVPK